MSKIPDTPKPKYNNNDAFRWVDSQWEKFMSEQKELKARISELEEENKNLKEQIEKLQKNLKRANKVIDQIEKVILISNKEWRVGLADADDD